MLVPQLFSIPISATSHASRSPLRILPRARPIAQRRIVAPVYPHQPRIPVLNPTMRVVRVDFAQLYLREDHLRQPLKHLVDVVAAQRRGFDRERYVVFRRPRRHLVLRHLTRPRRRGR